MSIPAKKNAAPPRKWKPINVRRLIAYVLEHEEKESPLLYPEPAFFVFVQPLLDFIRKEAGGMTEEEFNALADEIQGPEKP